MTDDEILSIQTDITLEYRQYKMYSTIYLWEAIQLCAYEGFNFKMISAWDKSNDIVTISSNTKPAWDYNEAIPVLFYYWSASDRSSPSCFSILPQNVVKSFNCSQLVPQVNPDTSWKCVITCGNIAGRYNIC